MQRGCAARSDCAGGALKIIREKGVRGPTTAGIEREVGVFSLGKTLYTLYRGLYDDISGTKVMLSGMRKVKTNHTESYL